MSSLANIPNANLSFTKIRPSEVKLIEHPLITKAFTKIALANANEMYNNKVLILWDVDADGLLSGYIADMQMRRCFPNMQIFNFINRDKSHGIKERTIEYIREHDIRVILIVDAGSNDINEIASLTEEGRLVVVIDHHEISERYEHENFILINCKDCEYGQEVSGAYLVNDVFKHFCSLLGHRRIKDFDELGVLSIVSDICKRDDFNRNVLLNYSHNLVEPSPFLALMKKKYHTNSVSTLNSLTSTINALLRKLGTEEMMRIFSSDHGFLRTLCYNSNKIKSDNDSIVYKILTNAKIFKFDNLVVVFLNPYDNYNLRDYMSIIANKIANLEKRLCVVLLDRKYSVEETNLDFDYTYSVRDSLSRDALTVFKQIGLDANGHKPAFGGKLKGEISTKLQRINEAISNLQVPKEYQGKVIDSVSLIDVLTKYMDDMYNISLWNTLSLQEDKVGFKFKFTGQIIKKRRVLQLLYSSLTITSFDMDIKDGDELVCFPELDGSVKLIAKKIR